jgi:glutaredoxin-dependent peroxiredoxin
VAVVGVSRDSPYSHLEWSRRLGLTFPLLSDWNAEAVRAFGVGQELDGLADTPVRSAFLADAGGVIRVARRYADDEVPDVGELLDAASAL